MAKDDPAMKKVRALFKQSGLSLNQLGLKIGYDPENARQAAFQFMKTADPRISMLRKVAEALGVELKALVE
jgi:transcriptional regulator with XRE-family HTH domain